MLNPVPPYASIQLIMALFSSCNEQALENLISLVDKKYVFIRAEVVLNKSSCHLLVTLAG